MRTLITGATGFLGSRLARELLELGHKVGIVSREASTYDQIEDVLPRLDVHVVDEHPESIRRAIVAAAPDVVFHCATYYVRDHRSRDLSRMLEANMAFPLRLLDAMAREGRRSLVNTGSAWQFFESPTYRPVCLHSATKQAFEAFIAYFVDIGAIDCITLIMHDSYGPDDPRRKIFRVLREHAGNTEPLQMSGGKQLIDFIHVDDVVAAYIKAGERLLESHRTCAHEIYSVSGGNPLPLRQVVETYLRFANVRVAIHWGGRPYNEREVMQPWRGGVSVPGWRPRVEIETGLRELAHSDDSALGQSRELEVL